MSACNQQPPEGHPFHGTGAACHMAEGHEGPHTWATEPSTARRAIDRVLATFPNREIESIDSQLPHPIEVYEVVDGVRADKPYRRWELPAGPWAIVKFIGGDEYAVWKHTGDIYRVGPDGAVDEEPIIRGAVEVEP